MIEELKKMCKTRSCYLSRYSFIHLKQLRKFVEHSVNSVSCLVFESVRSFQLVCFTEA